MKHVKVCEPESNTASPQKGTCSEYLQKSSNVYETLCEHLWKYINLWKYTTSYARAYMKHMKVCEQIRIRQFWKICGKLCEAESRHANKIAAPLKKTAIPGWKWDTKLLYIAVLSEPHPLILVLTNNFQHGTVRDLPPAH